jgi:molybdate transport system substrate-binding protein
MAMRLRLSAAVGVGFLVVLGLGAVARAGEIKVISTIGVKSVVEEMAPQYEQKTGRKLAITFGVANALKRQIEAGETFDLAIMTAAVADDLIKQGKLVAATRTDVARGGIGIAVRAGAPKPDIGSVESLKRALLAAKSITYTREGGSGIYFAGLLERLGIAEAMKSKTKYGTGNSPEMVAAGDAEMVVQLITELLPVRGIELVGPLPAEVQNYIVLTAGVGAQAKEPALAKDFLQFLTGPAAAPVIKAKGLEPGGSS